jgi:hypothetical protein
MHGIYTKIRMGDRHHMLGRYIKGRYSADTSEADCLARFYSLKWLRSADSHHSLNVVGRRAKYWSTQ